MRAAILFTVTERGYGYLSVGSQAFPQLQRVNNYLIRIEDSYKMPITKHPKKSEPLWKEWDYKAQKKGVHHTVYSVNGDRYTGDWDKNQKNGKWLWNRSLPMHLTNLLVQKAFVFDSLIFTFLTLHSSTG